MILQPTGTATFLFTDIEGSTKLWERIPLAMQAALVRHDSIVRSAIESNQGLVFKTLGDAFYGAFDNALDAVKAVIQVQKELRRESWGETGPLRVRAAIHTGPAEERDGDYFGASLNRVARLLSTGHGGQVLISHSSQQLVVDELPKGIALRDLGSHRLKDLIRPEHVYQVLIPELPSDFPPLRSLESRPNNLRAQPTSIIGREKEVATVCALLRRPIVRMVTLTGPGGSGKTKLSLQVAADLLDDFASGVFFVPLAPIIEPDLVIAAIAQTLNVHDTGGRPILEDLKEELHDKNLLLVLDSFERVLDAAAQIADLLAEAPRLKILITSRTLLHLYGEHEFEVPPLALPDMECLPPLTALARVESVRLFVERSEAVLPEFVLTETNARVVAEICKRLDGLPLAIELAAARSKHFSPEALLPRLSNRLKLLTGGARDLPARQQTLRATIAWSYNLLNEGEQVLLRRLGVFVGGMTAEAVEAVGNAMQDLPLEILEGTSSLVDKSLLRRSRSVEGDSRFWMLETIREYAIDLLDVSIERDAVQRLHAKYFLELAQRAKPELRGPNQITWIRRLDIEHGNLRTALAWATRLDVTDGLKAASALYDFWKVRGHLTEGREWLEGMLGGMQQKNLVRAEALACAGTLAYAQGDYRSAQALHEESIDIQRNIGDKTRIPLSLNVLGHVATYQGKPVRAVALYDESLAIRRELGDMHGIALSLDALGRVAMGTGDFEKAKALHEESLRISRKLGNKRGVAITQNFMGEMERCQKHYEEAAALYRESLVIAHELGDKEGVAWFTHNLAYVHLIQGDDREAQDLFMRSLLIFRELGAKIGLVYCFAGLAAVATVQHRLIKSARLYGLVDAMLNTMHIVMEIADRIEYDRHLERLKNQIDPAQLVVSRAEGRTLTVDQAISELLQVDPETTSAVPLIPEGMNQARTAGRR